VQFSSFEFLSSNQKPVTVSNSESAGFEDVSLLEIRMPVASCERLESLSRVCQATVFRAGTSPLKVFLRP